MRDDVWADRERRFDAHPVRTTILGLTVGWFMTLFAILLLLITMSALWFLGVLTSGIKGAGDAERIRNGAGNRIAAQEGFETRYQDIIAADRVINVTAKSLGSSPDDAKLRTELNGQKQYCVGLVGQYNADARKFTREAFRAADLPPEIGNNDPATDCEENR